MNLGRHKAPAGVERELFAFKVMYCGWECDEDGWVVEMGDGSKAIVLSSHGRLYVAEPSELAEKIDEYEAVLADSKKALAITAGAGTAET